MILDDVVERLPDYFDMEEIRGIAKLSIIPS